MAVTVAGYLSHRTSWRPLHAYSRVEHYDVTVRTVYGYRADCTCGWAGDVRPTVSACRTDILDHHANHD